MDKHPVDGRRDRSAGDQRGADAADTTAAADASAADTAAAAEPGSTAAAGANTTEGAAADRFASHSQCR